MESIIVYLAKLAGMKEDLISIGLKQESIPSCQDLIHILPNLWKKQGHNLQVRTSWRIILLEQGTSPCGLGQEWVSIRVKSSPHFWAWGDPSPCTERFWKTSSCSFPLLVIGQRKEMRIKSQYFMFTYKTSYNEIYKSTWFVFDVSFIVGLSLPFCYSGCDTLTAYGCFSLHDVVEWLFGTISGTVVLAGDLCTSVVTHG